MLLSKPITELLNKQLQHEGNNQLKYNTIRAYFEKYNLNGFAALFKSQSNGEREHYDKIYDYLADKNAEIDILGLAGLNINPGKDILTTCKAMAEQFYKIEIATTQAINNIVKAARSECDYTTEQWLFSFLMPEQIEEEKLALNIKAEIDRCVNTGDLNNMDARLLETYK